MKKFSSVILSTSLVFTYILPVVTLPVTVLANHDPFGGAPQTSVNICHQTGNGGYVKNSPSISSTGGNISFTGGHANHGGDIIPPFHFNDNGNIISYPGKNWTPINQDIWNSGGCDGDGIIPPPPTDVCPNIDGVQTQVPAGYHLEEGNCVPDVVPPTDVCPNLEGTQTEVPEGYHLEEGNCVENEVPPTDVCPNLEGTQTEVPEGYQINEAGDCVLIPVDVCPNLEGVQTVVPEGYHDEEGNCVPDAEEPTDVCPNIEDVQESVPEGYQVNEAGDCVLIPVDVCPNLDGTQTEVPSGYSLVDGSCILDEVPPTDLCPNDEGVQTTTPCPSDDVCPNDAGIQTNTEDCTQTPPTDVCPNVTGVQTQGPCADELCLSPNTWNVENQTCDEPETNPEPESNPETPSTPDEPTTRRTQGQFIMGGSSGQVLGASSCGLYMNKFIRAGRKNDPEQVMLLQEFLNDYEGANLPITGVYGPLTEAAVKAFQLKYLSEILTPWGENAPTGIVYQTTLRQINMIVCADLALEFPSLIPWSKNPNIAS